MNLSAIKTAVKTVEFVIKKHSPEILVGVGIAGTVVSTVMACKATLKVNDILEEKKQALNDIHTAMDMVKTGEIDPEKYTEKDMKHDTTIAYAKAAGKLAKIYAPAVIMGALSLGCIVGSSIILHRRNAALAAAYATLSKSFEAYREKVREKYGEEAEKDIRYGMTTEKVEEIVKDANGKDKKVTTEKKVSNIDGYSDYAVYFTKESSPNYDTSDNTCNLMFLRAQQNYANDLLRIYKRLTLNQVYDMLGMTHSIDQKLYKAGMVVGWKWEEHNTEGDNKVIFDIVETNRKLEDGTIEPAIILDFNVDGDIYSRM